MTLAACLVALLAAAPPVHAASLSFAGARPLFWGGMNELLERFGEANGVVVFPTAGGCSEAALGMRSGKIDMGGMCCLVDETLSEFTVVPVAMDAMTIIVHPSNPVDSVTLEQARDIFHGRITDWSGVEGPVGPITPVFRNHCDYKNEIFKREVVGDPALLAPATLVVDTIAKTLNYVGKYPKSVGHVSSVFSMGAHTVKALAVDGVYPTSENIASGRYPLSRELSLLVPKNPPREVVMFLEFMKSPEGRKILEKRLTLIPERLP
ncbi:MAG: substrate-binding domain-containing protein [Candidatus Nitrospinota bacterium M3_3B_026]